MVSGNTAFPKDNQEQVLLHAVKLAEESKLGHHVIKWEGLEGYTFTNIVFPTAEFLVVKSHPMWNVGLPVLGVGRIHRERTAEIQYGHLEAVTPYNHTQFKGLNSVRITAYLFSVYSDTDYNGSDTFEDVELELERYNLKVSKSDSPVVEVKVNNPKVIDFIKRRGVSLQRIASAA